MFYSVSSTNCHLSCYILFHVIIFYCMLLYTTACCYILSHGLVFYSILSDPCYSLKLKQLQLNKSRTYFLFPGRRLCLELQRTSHHGFCEKFPACRSWRTECCGAAVWKSCQGWVHDGHAMAHNSFPSIRYHTQLIWFKDCMRLGIPRRVEQKREERRGEGERADGVLSDVSKRTSSLPIRLA